MQMCEKVLIFGGNSLQRCMKVSPLGESTMQRCKILSGVPDEPMQRCKVLFYPKNLPKNHYEPSPPVGNDNDTLFLPKEIVPKEVTHLDLLERETMRLP